MKKTKNLKAFTLAEVLLTVAIIGIIAALTLPALQESYTQKIYTTKLNKVTHMITDATQSIIADERGSEDESLEEITPLSNKGFYYTVAGTKTSNNTQGVRYFLNNYFKSSKKNCRTGAGACVGTNYRNIQKQSIGAMPNNYYCIKTVNDAAVCMNYDNTDNSVKVIIDVNASEKPNMAGKDLYVAKITNTGFLQDLDTDPNNCSKGATILKAAAGCLNRAVAKENK